MTPREVEPTLTAEQVDEIEKQFPDNGQDHAETRAPIMATKPAIDDAAFHGLGGEIARAIEPHSEADPVAILANVLVGFGNVVGSSPHFLVDKTEHHTNGFVVEVGKTAKGRKGLAWSTPRYMLSQIDSEWGKNRIQGGLSSGEGLIYAVRDERWEEKSFRNGGAITYENVRVDKGVEDKRLLCIEQEFAQCLKVMSREGNILSEIVRNAWDGSRLAPMTKNSPIQATGAHISIIGHITKDELLRHLNDTEQANGFANRFIWLYLERSKEIPEPVGVPDEVLEPLIDRLRIAVDFARKTTLMTRDEAAKVAWRNVYHELSEEKPGLVGSILARAEAQVMRLACVYALLDECAFVRVTHMEAALALWEYSEKCARFIFGDSSGDPVVDRIMAALKQGPLSETEIRDIFGRHKFGEEIDRALGVMLQSGKAKAVVVETGGRPKTVWQRCDQSDKSDQR